MGNAYKTVFTHETVPSYVLDGCGEDVPVVEYWDVYRQQFAKAFTVDQIPDRAMAALPHDERSRIREWLVS